MKPDIVSNRPKRKKKTPAKFCEPKQIATAISREAKVELNNEKLCETDHTKEDHDPEQIAKKAKVSGMI
mgnify:CR=1 FL=1